MACCRSLQGQMQLALMDAPCSSAAAAPADPAISLPENVMGKVGDALEWVKKAKESVKKVLQSPVSGHTGQALKSQLKSKIEMVLRHQMALEEFRICASAPMSAVRQCLQETTQCLVEVQELIRAIHALG